MSVAIDEAHYAEITRDCCLAIKSYYTACTEVLFKNFIGITLLVIKRDNSISVLCHYFASTKVHCLAS